jgi:hypothetical protein
VPLREGTDDVRVVRRQIGQRACDPAFEAGQILVPLGEDPCCNQQPADVGRGSVLRESVEGFVGAAARLADELGQETC